jgi:hypothetical protein
MDAYVICTEMDVRRVYTCRDLWTRAQSPLWLAIAALPSAFSSADCHLVSSVVGDGCNDSLT